MLFGFGKQSGAYVMEADHGFNLPRRLQMEFSKSVQRLADDTGQELTSDMIYRSFDEQYLSNEQPYSFVTHTTVPDTHASELRRIEATVKRNGEEIVVHGKGNGPIDAFVHALKDEAGIEIKVIDYSEHAISAGSDAQAVAYLEAETGDGTRLYGVGRDQNIVRASLKAICSAVNRAVAM